MTVWSYYLRTFREAHSLRIRVVDTHQLMRQVHPELVRQRNRRRGYHVKHFRCHCRKYSSKV